MRLPTLLWPMAIAMLAGVLRAHEVRPAYLQMRQTGAETWDVLWKVPARGELRLGIDVRLPGNCLELSLPRARMVGNAYLRRWSIACEGGLVGREICIDGLPATMIDVLVRVERADGSVQVVRLFPSRPSFTVEAAPGWLQVAGTYLGLGVEHILLGIDHLLFVLVLLFLVRGWRPLVVTITAFTVAHSLTLAVATLGILHVPQQPVEAIIALSIVFVASEILHARQGRPGLTERWPWIVALTFGLLHGFGFAGALHEVGLPESSIPLALLFFNLGVEAGQLLFVGALVAAWLAARTARARLRDDAVPSIALARTTAVYAIGSVAAYWVMDRTVSFWA